MFNLEVMMRKTEEQVHNLRLAHINNAIIVVDYNSKHGGQKVGYHKSNLCVSEAYRLFLEAVQQGYDITINPCNATNNRRLLMTLSEVRNEMKKGSTVILDWGPCSTRIVTFQEYIDHIVSCHNVFYNSAVYVME